MLISLIINLDTRPENLLFGGNNLDGCVSEDFLTEGLFNKKQYLKGFDFETIAYVDIHQPISYQSLDYLISNTDALVLRKHTNEPKFNDWNYMRALQMASGDIILHIDGDTCAFTNSPKHIQYQIDLLEKYDYISYPSHWTPNAVHDPNYDYSWCSTRYFLCKRETIDFTEIKKCLSDSDYLYNKYPASIKNPWTEHCLGLISKYTGKGVYYPPIELDNFMVFSWSAYDKYILNRLNSLPYDRVKDWVLSKGGIQYPVDVKGN